MLYRYIFAIYGRIPMKIVIVGCGKVGSTLAVKLQEEGHEITVIDHSERVIE